MFCCCLCLLDCGRKLLGRVAGLDFIVIGQVLPLRLTRLTGVGLAVGGFGFAAGDGVLVADGFGACHLVLTAAVGDEVKSWTEGANVGATCFAGGDCLYAIGIASAASRSHSDERAFDKASC